MKVTPAQRLFNKGELSPLIYARTDYEGYGAGLKIARNAIPLIQGPITRRPGTMFVAGARYNNKLARLVPFQFSTSEVYALEFGDLYFRIYRDEGRVESPPGAPITVSTPYIEVDLPLLKYAQSADVLYMAHPGYAPRKISRTSDTVWTVTEIDFQDGPYLPVNTTATTMTAGATSGATTLTASSIVGVNKGVGFRAGDVGRLVRYNTSGSVWGWMKITGWVSTTQVNVTIVGTLGATPATANWRLGVWNSVDGYPTCVCFFEDRLCWGGAGASPSRIDMSQSANYEVYFPTLAADNTIADDYAVAVSLNSSDVQRVQWMLDDERGLLAGTPSGEWLVRGSEVQRNTVTPTNVSAKQTSSYGSADVMPVRAGKPTLFATRSRRKLRELSYVYTDDGYRAPDLSVLAPHLTRAGIRDMTYQKEPQSLIWVTLQDFSLRGVTYDREQNVIAWHQHALGGFANEGHTLDSEVLSHCSIPAPDDSYDQVWFLVRRWVNGQVRVYVEYMTRMWERGDDQATAVYVDSALVYEGTATDTILGLDHLANEVVSVLADGAAHPNVTVGPTGTVALNRAAETVVLGLGYVSDGQSLRFDAGSQIGSSLGKPQQINNCRFEVHDGLGLKIGPTFTDLQEVTFRTSADASDTAVPLRTGIYERKPWASRTGRDENVCWRWYQAFPGTILAVLPSIRTEDDG